jgi:copper chaperone CopZ/thioredoxin-related protein
MFKPTVRTFRVGVLVLLLAGCTTKPKPQGEAAPQQDAPPSVAGKGDSSKAAGPQRVTLYVESMTKVQGITWLTWPNGVKEALSGLPGIASLEVDLKKDQFRITYDPERITVRKQGFRGGIVKDATAGPQTAGKVHRDLARLPEDLRKEVQQAKKDGKHLLLAFHGPGWLPCKRMDTVTYPNAQVKQELASWVLLKVDIVERREVAELFEVVGIPVAVAVTAEGDELGRIEDFVEPAAFRSRLEKWRPGTKQK